MAIEPVPSITPLTTVPNRQTQTGNELSNNMDAFSFAIGPWGDSIKLIGDNVYNNAQEAEQFAQNSSDFADDSQGYSQDSQGYAQDSLGYAQESQSARDQAIAAVSALPDGTVDNGEPSKVNAWSSEKVAQVTNTSPSKPIFYADFTSQTYWGWKGFENGFVSGPFSEFFTFSRGSTQTAVSPAGVIKTIAVDKPLLGWEEGSPKGVELYPAVENLCADSTQYTSGSYWLLDTFDYSIDNQNQLISPDGVLIDSVKIDDAGGYIRARAQTPSDSVFFATIHVNVGSVTSNLRVVTRNGNDGNSKEFVFNFYTLEVVSVTSGVTPYIQKRGDWVVVGMSNISNTVSTDYEHIEISPAVETVGEHFFVCNAQITTTPYPAPYQKTEGPTVTTDNNDCSLNTDQFEFDGSGDWTVIAKFNPKDFSASSFDNRYLNIQDSSNSGTRVEIMKRPDGRFFLEIYSGGVFQFSKNIEVLVSDSVFSVAIRKEGLTVSAFINSAGYGGGEITDNASMSDINIIQLGRGFLAPLTRAATIFKSLEIHQEALTDEECEVATS